MKHWMNSHLDRKLRLSAGVFALALAALFATFEFAQPATAYLAPAPVATAAPLDDARVGPIVELDRAMETLAARVTPAVVNVTVTARAKQNAQAELPDELQQFFGPQFGQRMRPQPPRVEHGLGSGVVISPEGYIVTNNHVVDGATEIEVTSSDRRVFRARLVGTDPLTDLAVIKVDKAGLASVPWGDSTALHPGQTVLAFGNPLGFRFTVTRGIVSALNRPNPFSDDARKPGEFIQTDAAINPGNSGGALVDARGELIGINTFLVSQSGSFSGMGFAIPAQIAKPTVEALIRDGKIEHAYMGVGIGDVTPQNARFFHMASTTGAVITQVEAGSPAANAGVKVGDVITELNGHAVQDAGQLQVAITQLRPGADVRLGLLRDGKNQTLPVTLGSFDRTRAERASATEEHGKGRWGLGLGDLTPDVRQQLEAPAQLQGALVAQVEPGSPADNAGVARGAVILQVNRNNVRSAGDVQKALSAVPKGEDAMLLIWQNGGSNYVVMHAPSS